MNEKRIKTTIEQILNHSNFMRDMEKIRNSELAKKIKKYGGT